MAVAVKMPQMGESMVEGTVARWLKSPGESVEKLEPLLEINTDKIDMDVPAPATGVLLRVLIEAGETADVGTTLAYIGEPGEAIDEVDGTGESKADRPPTPGSTESDAGKAEIERRVPKDTRPIERPSGRDYISPVVARIAAEHSVELEQVPGTGMGGRITKKDVLAHLAEASTDASTTAAPETAGADPLGAEESWSPLSAMRQAIATHMVQSKQTSPHVTTVFEVDMTAVVRHRAAHRQAFDARGIRLTYTPYFVAAAVAGLQAVPKMNSRFQTIDGRAGMVQHQRMHIGLAVALESGLIVPVLRDADERNLAGLARAVNEITQRARRGKLDPSMTRGGTFTITNHGVSGSLLGTPIINQPQAAILGVGAIVKRPVVRSQSHSLLPDADDAIVIRPMCYLSLSFDHRLVDGAEADRFMAAVVERLTNWSPHETDE